MIERYAMDDSSPIHVVQLKLPKHPASSSDT
jgi:hypothetical protein